MLKKIVLGLTFVGMAVGMAHAAGLKCTFCNGTGFQGAFNCTLCKGTGRNSSY